jgi:hypothetical protein
LEVIFYNLQSDNSLKFEKSDKFCQFLNNNVFIQVLDFRHNKISNEGCKLLCHSLEDHKFIQILNLKGIKVLESH